MSVYLFVLALVAIVMYGLYAITRIGVDRRDSGYGADETELIQELHRGLARMQERIETLETLLLDRAEKTQRRADLEKELDELERREAAKYR